MVDNSERVRAASTVGAAERAARAGVLAPLIFAAPRRTHAHCRNHCSAGTSSLSRNRRYTVRRFKRYAVIVARLPATADIAEASNEAKKIL
jgi:hypothetical protein